MFLHGVGTDASMWAREIALLTDYHCLAPDFPGHGRTHPDDVPAHRKFALLQGPYRY